MTTLARLAVLAVAAVAAAAMPAIAQEETPLEYRVKAAYLFNFTKFVEWPADLAGTSELHICIASANPFGEVLQEIIRDELVNGRPLRARVIRQPAADCHVLFVPRGVPHAPYLRAFDGKPVLTVGEAPSFLRDGGIVNFRVDQGKVRFEIAREAAARAQLTISSRLLRLAAGPVSELVPTDWRHPRRAWRGPAGAAPERLRDGGIVNVRVDQGKVRFEIAREAAARTQLTISSRLLRIAAGQVSELVPTDRRHPRRAGRGPAGAAPIPSARVRCWEAARG